MNMMDDMLIKSQELTKMCADNHARLERLTGETWSESCEKIPAGMMSQILDWVETGDENISDFLWAVIKNDLLEACTRADETNIKLLHAYVKVFYNQCPSPCWGSVEKAKAWLDKGGLKGGTLK